MKKILLFTLIFLVLISSAIAVDISRGPGGPKPPEPGRELVFDLPAEENLLNKAIKSPLFWALTIAAVFWSKKYPKEKKNKYFVYFGFAIVFGYIAIFSLLTSTGKVYEPILPTTVPSDWLQAYQSELPEEYKKYTVETEYYDYSHPTIQKIDDAILSVARNEREAVQMALDYVYQNVEYNFYESDEVCFKATGSSVIESKSGQCDSQSLSIISILRGLDGTNNGIAARPVGGCLSLDPSCKLKMAVFALLGIEERKPKWTELGEINISQQNFSRGQEDVESRRGGLHLWIEAYFDANNDGRREWVTLEGTSGEIIKKDSCYRYDFELYPDETSDEKKYMCVSDDINFALFCSKR